MQLIKELFSVNEILTVSIVSWFVAQVLKTIINFILVFIANRLSNKISGTGLW